MATCGSLSRTLDGELRARRVELKAAICCDDAVADIAAIVLRQQSGGTRTTATSLQTPSPEEIFAFWRSLQNELIR